MNFSETRPALLLYRDIIRVVNHIMEPKRKLIVRSMVRKEFERNRKLRDEKEIITLKKNAGKAMTNLYLLEIKKTIPKGNV